MKLDSGISWPSSPRSSSAASVASTGALARHGVLMLTLIACVLGSIYWLVLATDRYVSEARVLVQRTDLPAAQGSDVLGSLLTGAGSSSNRSDQLLLREHLLSIDMLHKLEASLQLRKHYTNPEADALSRLWQSDAPLERLHRHYQSRVSIEFDDYTGVLTIAAQGYDPKVAHAITSMLVAEGERFMNAMANGLAQSQVKFLEAQVTSMYEQTRKARQALLAYQDTKGILSPAAAAEGVSAVITRLEAQRSDLQVQRGAMQAYLVPDHPNLLMINQQMESLDRQIGQEKAKLAAPSGRTLNRTVEEFQRLEAEASFRQDLYKSALAALEKGQVEAHRTARKVSILQAPTQPEYALQPRRVYNTIAFIVIAVVVAGIAQLLVAIVRDHRE